jgi:hypothetical protein
MTYDDKKGGLSVPHNNRTAVRKAAASYIQNGNYPIPIPHETKGPILKEWPALRLSEDQIPSYFDKEQMNLGLILGEASNGLVDIDLDCRETRILAGSYLPDTGQIWGRDSSPSSHWLFQCRPVPKSMTFKDPVSGEMLVELRSDGQQTVAPPSVHPSGEAVRFDLDGEPIRIDADNLVQCVSRLAVVALLARHWPEQGSRNEAALAIAGGLLRANLDEALVSNMLLNIARTAGDEEAESRANSVNHTAKKLASGHHVTGWPSASEIIGSKVIEKVLAWLGLESAPGTGAVQVPIMNLPVLSLSQLYEKNIPEPKVLVPWLKEGGLAMVFGNRGVGKSFFSLGLSISLATGGQFLSWPVTTPVDVLYVDGEMALSEFRDRIKHLVGPAQTDRLSILSHEEVYRDTEQDMDLGIAVWQEAIMDYISKHPKIRVVVLDNLSCLLPSIAEDKRDDWTRRVAPYLIGLRRRGIAVVLVHHAGKSGSQRGTSAREDLLDTVIQLAYPSGYEQGAGLNFTVTFTKSRGCFGDDLEPIEASLDPEAEGMVGWSWKPLERTNEDYVLGEIGLGNTKQADIAETLTLSAGAVSKICQRLAAKGSIRKEGTEWLVTGVK